MRCVIDDDANFFDEWREDRATYNIGNNAFGRSHDDPNVSAVLRDQEAQRIYEDKFFDKYTETSRLVPIVENHQMNDAELALTITLQPQGVVFYEIRVA